MKTMTPTTSWPAPDSTTPSPVPGAALTAWKTGPAVTMTAGIGAVAVGLFLPWVTIIAPFVGQISRTGLDTPDGKLFGVAAVVLAIVLFNELRAPHFASQLALLIGGAVIGLGLGVEYQDISHKLAGLDSEFASVAVGIGLYLGIAGAVATTIGAACRFGSSR